MIPHAARSTAAPQRLLLATANPHKVGELRAIFARAPQSPEIIGLSDLPEAIRDALTEPAESGTTFEQNATIKALDYARQTGEFCLADDSGLAVDALNGAPGVISSHYCSDGRDTDPPMPRAERDIRNNALLLDRLAGVPAEQRSARFVCVMALAAPASDADGSPRILALTRGTFEGRIGLPPRVPGGTDGFGYDPLFLVAPDFERTAAELPPDEKNCRSHRAAAAAAMLDRLAGIQPLRAATLPR